MTAIAQCPDLCSLGIAALGEAISSKQVSPVEAADAYLERIARLDDRFRAYISTASEQASSAARAAENDIQAGNYRGPLHGVPVAVKDLFLVEGLPRTGGSRVLGEDPSRRDATSVARLKAAGAVVLGTLNLHEFAYGPTGINPHYGTARNPWNTERVCGGSSSGSGAAVAARLAAGALGTDTGGSIRIPAALCGVVGLKQTYGLASRDGIYPLCETFDHGGPLARSVEDVALLLQAIAGTDPRDPSTRNAQVGEYTSALRRDLVGLRIGVPKNYFFDDLHPDVSAAVRAALSVLEELGAQVAEIELPFVQAATEAWTSMALAESYLVHEQHLSDHAGELSEDVRDRLGLGKAITARQLVHAQWCRTEVIREMGRVLEAVDLLATPASPIPAVRVSDAAVTHDGRSWQGPEVLGRLCRLAAFTGQPALSLPCGFTADGLPVGLQLLGDWFCEPLLLGAAHAYEQATDWHRRRPTALDAPPESL